VSLVLGGGHSIGVPLAVSADRSFIVKSATMTLHPVRTNGLVLGVYQSFTYFHRMQERIIRFIADHSEISEERLQELMLKTDEIATDMGSVIDGEQAVKEGLIDRLGGISEALEELERLIKEQKGG
jgi:ATP-dependent protease ClpP protease subunit